MGILVEQVKVQSTFELDTDQKKQLDTIISECKRDKETSRIVEEISKLRVILVGNCVVGIIGKSTMCPYKGRIHYRAGAPFIASEFRGNGYASETIKDFYSFYKPGLAWIAFDNDTSIKMYEKLGFVRGDYYDWSDTDIPAKEGHWYTLV